jgi:hypothetical protein
MNNCFGNRPGLANDCKKCKVINSCIREWNNKYCFISHKMCHTKIKDMAEKEIKEYYYNKIKFLEG